MIEHQTEKDSEQLVDRMINARDLAERKLLMVTEENKTKTPTSLCEQNQGQNQDTHIALDFLQRSKLIFPTDTQSCGISFHTCPKHAIAKSLLMTHRITTVSHDVCAEPFCVGKLWVS